MSAKITNGPYYPRGFSQCDIEFSDYVMNYCRLTKYVACMYATYCRRLVADIGNNKLLSSKDIDSILTDYLPDFNTMSFQTRTKYRKVLRIYREYMGFLA